MPFPLPSLATTREFLLAVGKAVLPGRNFDNLRSFFGRRTTFISAAVTQLHSHVDTVQKDVHPLTAGDNGPIDDWGEVKGVKRKGATPARALVAGRVRGANGTAVTAGTELLQPSSGLRFKIGNSTTVPATEFVDVDITAVDVGEQTRLLANTQLKFLATPPGLESFVVLQKDLDLDGTDTEQFGPYRRRLLDAFSAESSGGSQSDYVKWALDKESPLPLVAAYAYPNRAGFGTVDVVGLKSGRGAERILTGGENAELLAWLKTKAPAHLAGTIGALRVLTVIADPQVIEIVLTPNGESAYAFDWTGGPLTVTAYNSATREVTFSTDLPATMKAGHRGSFKTVGAFHDGREFRIEALSAVNKLILETAPVVDPVNTDLFYSGGPLVTPVRDALVAHLDGKFVYAGKGGVPIAEDAVDSTVGLEVLAEGVGSANPAGVYGTWIGGLLRGVIGGIAIHKAGVRNFSISLPAADYEATDDAFPNDAQIHMVTTSSVLVRGAT